MRNHILALLLSMSAVGPPKDCEVIFELYNSKDQSQLMTSSQLGCPRKFSSIPYTPISMNVHCHYPLL